MCSHCFFDYEQNDYTGEYFEVDEIVDGHHQGVETYLFDSPEDECFVMVINGCHMEYRMKVKYCPKCGRNLYEPK